MKLTDINPTAPYHIKTTKGEVVIFGMELIQLAKGMEAADQFANDQGYGHHAHSLRSLVGALITDPDKQWACFNWLREEFCTPYINAEGDTRYYVEREGKNWHPFGDGFPAARAAVEKALKLSSSPLSLTAITKRCEGAGDALVKRVLLQMQYDGNVGESKVQGKGRGHVVYHLTDGGGE